MPLSEDTAGLSRSTDALRAGAAYVFGYWYFYFAPSKGG